jgi:hypothetical protein
LRPSPESVFPRSPDGLRMSPVPATVPADALLRTKYFQNDYSFFLLLIGVHHSTIRPTDLRLSAPSLAATLMVGVSAGCGRQRPGRGMEAAFHTITLERGEAVRSVLADSSGSEGADSSLSTRSRSPGLASGALLCQPPLQPSSSQAGAEPEYPGTSNRPQRTGA